MTLHPQARAFLDALIEQGAPAWDELPPNQARETFSGFTEVFGTGPELLEVRNVVCDEVPARLYRPRKDELLPCVVYFHGGGWVIGDLDTHDPVCRRLAKESDCVVVSVDYRLAPENPFPAAMDDCYTALQFLNSHSNELGLNAKKLAVAGDSAGGNLAAAMTHRSRDESGAPISLQILIYPVIEPQFDSGSYVEFDEGYGLSNRVMQYFWQQYVGDQDVSENPYAVPSVANQMHGLPKTLVVTAEYDVLRDEGERYAKTLSESGCDVTLIRYDGTIHGFVHLAGVFDDGTRATAKIGRFIKKHFQ